MALLKSAAIMAASLIAALSVPSSIALAAAPEVFTGRFSNIAVGGYDSVAFFDAGEPVKGRKEFTFDYAGAKWRFASQENLDRFAADPEAYAPQYGGYCAWAVSQGYTAPGNAKNWTIHDGKLYLNFNDKVQADWLKDPAGFIAKAEANWPAVLDE